MERSAKTVRLTGANQRPLRLVGTHQHRMIFPKQHRASESQLASQPAGGDGATRDRSRAWERPAKTVRLTGANQRPLRLVGTHQHRMIFPNIELAKASSRLRQQAKTERRATGVAHGAICEDRPSNGC